MKRRANNETASNNENVAGKIQLLIACYINDNVQEVYLLRSDNLYYWYYLTSIVDVHY